MHCDQHVCRRGQLTLQADSGPAILPVIWLPGVMSYCNDDGSIFPDDEGDVIRKSGQVHPAPAALSQSPEQRMLHDGSAGILKFVAESGTEARHSGLVVPGDAAGLGFGFREEYETEVHLSGAIPRSFRKTSPAGTTVLRPESNAPIRREISPAHAASAVTGLSVSTLSMRASARRIRSSAGSTRA